MAVDRTAHCPTGYYSSEHDPTYCYKFVSNPASFDTAEAYCQSLGGHLGSIPDGFANFFLAEKAATELPNSTDFWIGASQISIQNLQIWIWKWYQAIVNYNDWGNGQPNSNYHCAAVDISSAFWSSQQCSSSKSYVCQVPAVINLCDSGWTYFNVSGFCYKLFTTNGVSYSSARQSCVSNSADNRSADLVSIHSEAENNFVRQLTTPPTTLSLANTSVWIGYVYGTGWSDGSLFNYSKFYSNPSSSYVYTIFIPDGTSSYVSYPGYWASYNYVSAYNSARRYVCKQKPTTYPYIL